MIEVAFNDTAIRRAFQSIERALTDTSDGGSAPAA